MPEQIVSATTTHDGKVYLLKSRGYIGGWSIVSAEKISEDKGYHVVAVGQEKYVRNKWKEFVNHQTSFKYVDVQGHPHFAV